MLMWPLVKMSLRPLYYRMDEDFYYYATKTALILISFVKSEQKLFFVITMFLSGVLGKH